jgi:hypothetical protein
MDEQTMMTMTIPNIPRLRFAATARGWLPASVWDILAAIGKGDVINMTKPLASATPEESAMWEKRNAMSPEDAEREWMIAALSAEVLTECGFVIRVKG